MKSPAAIKEATRRTRVLDRDDELAFVAQCIVDSDMTTVEIAANALNHGYSIAASTMERWLDGKVIRPQNYTVNAAMHGMGYIKTWKRVTPVPRRRPH